MNDYAALEKFIYDRKASELENYKEGQRLSGDNSPGACLALGAMDAYSQVLLYISEPSAVEGTES